MSDEDKRKLIKELIVGNVDQEAADKFLFECWQIKDNGIDSISPEKLAEAICNLIFDPLK